MHTNRKTSSPVSDLRIRLSEGGLPCDENTHVNTIMSWLVERLMSWINKAKVCLFRLLGLCSVGRTHPKQSLPLKRVTPIAYIPLLLICCLEEFLKQQLILEYEPSVCVCVCLYLLSPVLLQQKINLYLALLALSQQYLIEFKLTTSPFSRIQQGFITTFQLIKQLNIHEEHSFSFSIVKKDKYPILIVF